MKIIYVIICFRQFWLPNFHCSPLQLKPVLLNEHGLEHIAQVLAYVALVQVHADLECKFIQFFSYFLGINNQAIPQRQLHQRLLNARALPSRRRRNILQLKHHINACTLPTLRRPINPGAAHRGTPGRDEEEAVGVEGAGVDQAIHMLRHLRRSVRPLKIKGVVTLELGVTLIVYADLIKYLNNLMRQHRSIALPRPHLVEAGNAHLVDRLGYFEQVV